MSLSSKQLENEIEAMENRLANVKVVVEIEKHAWKKVARKGKCGAKWKGAVTNSAKTGGSTAATTSARSETENSHGEIVVEPMHWDALELAQFLQSKQLAPYAQIVVFENITGKLLLETPPGRLRSVFDGIVAGNSDAKWKEFLRVCSQLHKLQKSTNPAHSNRQDEPNQRKRVSTPPKSTGSGVVFPLISPRAPGIMASSLASKMHKPQPPPPTASLLVGDPDARQLKTAAPHALGRKAGSSSLTQQMVTCWNCGARFPRALPSTIPSRSGPTMSSGGGKTGVTKLYCSKACQDAIESSDMSVSASLSVAVPHDTIQHQVPKPPPSHGATLKAVIKSPRHQPTASHATSDSFSFLQVAHTGPSTTLEDDATRQPTGVVKQPSGRKRMVAPAVSGGLSPVASITAVRCLPDDAIPPSLLLHGASSTRLQSRVIQQSRYKLDPELFDPNRAHWSACFDATLSPAQNLGCIENSRVLNLETLVGFLSNKGVYRLSLTCRKWFELVHVHVATVDRLWTLLLQRSWIQDDDDWKCLRDLGFVSTKAKKPRRLMMKLTRHVQKAVLEGMKLLLNVENWQLAPTCRNDLDYLPLPLRRSQWMALNASGRDEPTEPIDRGNDLYEVITVICNRSCEIVAVQAQELIRPIAEDGSTIEILNGVKNGSLWGVECRRLRLFSTANRLPFSEWYLLPDILVMLEFCTRQDPRSTENPGPSTWQLKVLSRLQIQMDKRLLSKESVQQVMKGAQERNAPDDALAAMEQFLLQHAPALVTSGASTSKPRG